MKFGTLRSVWVARKPPGFAFIEFQDPRDADDACRDVDGKLFVASSRIDRKMLAGGKFFSFFSVLVLGPAIPQEPIS